MIPPGGAAIAQHGSTRLVKIGRPVGVSLNIQPMIILNDAESGWQMSSHLATMGFCVLRARSSLVEKRLVPDR